MDIYSYKDISNTLLRSLGVGMNFIKKRKVVFLFSSAVHWNKGAASMIAVIGFAALLPLLLHFHVRESHQTGAQSLCSGSRRDLLWWVLPGALPQIPGPSTNLTHRLAWEGLTDQFQQGAAWTGEKWLWGPWEHLRHSVHPHSWLEPCGGSAAQDLSLWQSL